MYAARCKLSNIDKLSRLLKQFPATSSQRKQACIAFGNQSAYESQADTLNSTDSDIWKHKQDLHVLRPPDPGLWPSRQLEYSEK